MKAETRRFSLGDKGLRPHASVRKDQGWAEKASGLRLREHGPESFSGIDSIIDAATLYDTYDISVNTPHPQIMKGIGIRYLVTKQRLYKIDYSAGAYSLTRIWTYDSRDSETKLAPLGGGAWQFIDFDQTWMMVNGSATMFKASSQVELPISRYDSTQVYVENSVSINAGCQFQGRAVIGGFNNQNFYNADWREFWEYWSQKNNPGMQFQVGFDQNWVMWTMVGAADLLWLFYPELANQGVSSGSGYDSDNPIIFDMLKRGDSGFAVMPFQGAVKDIRQMGGKVMVFGEDGSAELRPFVDPAPSFGVWPADVPGIANTGAVAGDKNMQALMDPEGNVWLITPEETKNLGYKEFGAALLGEDDVMVSFNPVEREFYFSNGFESLVLTQRGMTQTDQAIITTMYDNGKVYGVTR